LVDKTLLHNRVDEYIQNHSKRQNSVQKKIISIHSGHSSLQTELNPVMHYAYVSRRSINNENQVVVHRGCQAEFRFNYVPTFSCSIKWNWDGLSLLKSISIRNYSEVSFQHTARRPSKHRRNLLTICTYFTFM
jgi:hypothetical protein